MLPRVLQDDLRKDGRLMEFNSVVNRCLRRDPESGKRDLHIRTFVRLLPASYVYWSENY